MKKQTGTRVLSGSEVEEFLATAAPSQLLRLVEPLRRNVDQLLNLLESQTVGTQLLSDVQFIVMGNRTIQTVFESLR